MPSLRQLQYLVALDDHRHFGRAAFAVHVSQPTLSQQLRTLEARLDASLIDRSGQDVQLTPLGRRNMGKLYPTSKTLTKASLTRSVSSLQVRYLHLALLSCRYPFGRWLFPKLLRCRILTGSGRIDPVPIKKIPSGPPSGQRCTAL